MGNTSERNALQQPKENVTVRMPVVMRNKIDSLGKLLRRNRSEMIEFAVEELLDMSAEEISKRMLKRAAKTR